MDRCKRQLRGGIFRWMLAISAVAVAFDAGAQETQTAYALNAGVGTTDNIGRTSQDEVDETIATAGVNFSLFRESSRLETDLNGDFSYVKYLDDIYDDELIGNFIGQAILGIIPDRVEWLLRDTFGQTTQQAFSAVTPETREDINYFTTGPRFMFGMGSAFRVNLDGRFSKVTYEESPLDNERIGGDLAFIRDLSPRSSVSLNVHYSELDFEDEINVDFDRSEIFARYEREVGRTTMGVDLGHTEIERRGQSDSGIVVRADLSRRVSPSSMLSVSLGRESSDSGDIFEQLQSMQTGSSGTLAVQPTSEPFTNKYGTLGWYFDRTRTSLGFSFARFEEEYEGQSALDRTRDIVAASFRRDLTPALQFRMSVQREDNKSVEGSDEFSQNYAMALLGWRLGRRVSLELQYERFDGKVRSDNALDEYQENRGWLRIALGGGARRTPTFAPVQTGTNR
jgi:hypothetical protein